MLKLNRIVFPVDLNSLNKGVLQGALEIAQQFQSEIHFLYVNSPQAGYRVAFDHEDQMALKIKDLLSNHTLLNELNIKYAAVKGEVEVEVSKYSTMVQADLIVVGKTHHSELYETIFGSNDQKIIHETNIPVLVLPG